MADNYDTLLVQRGAEEAFRIAADDARKLRSRIETLEAIALAAILFAKKYDGPGRTRESRELLALARAYSDNKNQ